MLNPYYCGVDSILLQQLHHTGILTSNLRFSAEVLSFDNQDLDKGQLEQGNISGYPRGGRTVQAQISPCPNTFMDC